MPIGPGRGVEKEEWMFVCDSRLSFEIYSKIGKRKILLNSVIPQFEQICPVRFGFRRFGRKRFGFHRGEERRFRHGERFHVSPIGVPEGNGEWIGTRGEIGGNKSRERLTGSTA